LDLINFAEFDKEFYCMDLIPAMLKKL